jgi:predicted ATPase
MIEHVQFSNFKSFEFSKPIRLPRFVVLVGNNSAGKTNFCDAFTFARDLLESGLRSALLDDERRKGFENIVRGRKPSRQIAFHFSFTESNGLNLAYEFRVGISARTGEPQILYERLAGRLETRRGVDTIYLERDTSSSRVYNELSSDQDKREKWGIEANYLQVAQLKDPQRFPALNYVREALGPVWVLRPDTGILRQRAPVGGDLNLGNKGQGLIAILDAAGQADLDRLARFLAEGDPSIKAIRLLGAGEGHKDIGLLEQGEERPYGPHQISDGTLRLLVMLTAIRGIAPTTKTLIIEEPENSIHFDRLRRLVELCRRRVAQDEQARIILTTHSIPLLHALDRQEAMAVVRDQEGISRILHPPTKKRWQQFQAEAGYTTGLWPEPEPRIYEPRSRE